jgi:hypothetical protein
VAKATPLTALKVRSITAEGFYRDADTRGLYLQVSHLERNGVLSPDHGVTKSWLYRFVSPLTGKARWMGLGSCTVISVAEARRLAKDARRLVTLGVDPIEDRRTDAKAKREAYLREQASRMTFEACAEAYLAEHLSTFRNEKHRKQWATSLERASRAFGELNVAEIDTAILVKFLEPIWRATPETGSRVRGRVEKVLDWAKARGFRQGENPARWKGHLQHLLKAQHHESMPFAELPAFMGEAAGQGVDLRSGTRVPDPHRRPLRRGSWRHLV